MLDCLIWLPYSNDIDNATGASIVSKSNTLKIVSSNHPADSSQAQYELDGNRLPLVVGYVPDDLLTEANFGSELEYAIEVEATVRKAREWAEGHPKRTDESRRAWCIYGHFMRSMIADGYLQ